MVLTNLMKATLYQYNRKDDDNPYDDMNVREKKVRVCPYSVDVRQNFGIYSHPEATGYYIVKDCVDIRIGDQLEFGGQRFTILEVKDNWIWNKIANITIAVK